jgi:DNA mismatch repair protein MutS
MVRITPAIQQYLEIKEKHQDAILFFRMGDFYEMFFEDAEVASKILEITLTSRNKESGIPLCGVPYHAGSAYIAKLIDHGYKVAICEQVEEPGSAKGIVKREVTRVVTPGLVDDPDNLKRSENNFLMGIFPNEDRFGISFLDISTGEFRASDLSGLEALSEEVLRIGPKEVLLPCTCKASTPWDECLRQWHPSLVNYLDLSAFDQERSRQRLLNQFGTTSLSGFGSEGLSEGIRAAGAVLHYVRETQKREVGHIKSLLPYRFHDFMIIDDWTKRNLELFETIQERTKTGSLISVLDKANTPMGARMLRRWMNYPVLDSSGIRERLDGVGELKEAGLLRETIRRTLEGVYDMERLISRISLGTANARDMIGLKRSFQTLPGIKGKIETLKSEIVRKIHLELDPLDDLASLIERTIVEDPPVGLREGGLIKEGFDPELDELIRLGRDGKSTIADMALRERERTGIASLKVGYNRVFGYYIEVTKTHSHAIPPDYIRKQTLVNAERYINEELKQYEMRILGANERRMDLEYRIFERLRKEVASQTGRIQKVADAIARLDVILSFAEVADRNRYVMPVIDNGDRIHIEEGRHPVIEQMSLSEQFVPNDAELDCTSNQIIILTGPNMAGKSTYLRQLALIVYMAQIGSFVPAKEAVIGVVDRIFTRVGALDNLAKGQSTFLVEMNETASLLHNATDRSLIVLDEIGRGTSTFDGLSIAWAVAEYIHDHPKLRCKTIFATHYHELTDLAKTKERVKNQHIAVKEWDDRIIFLRKVAEGGTSRSYGIQVARLAGIPSPVIDRAKEILTNLEKGELDGTGMPAIADSKGVQRSRRGVQLNLFRAEEARIFDAFRKVEARK